MTEEIADQRIDYDTKTDRVLESTGDFEPADFLRLAAACLDQAGASVDDLREAVSRLADTAPPADTVPSPAEGSI